MTHKIDSLPAEILLGQQGEKGANSVLFDATAWVTLYSAAEFSITYTRHGETAVYPESAGNVAIETLQDEAGADISILIWTPGAAALDVAGQGTVVIHCVEDEVEKRSVMACTHIEAGHAAASEAPEPLAGYIAKWGSVDISVESLASGSLPTASISQDASGTHILLGIAGNPTSPS